jgi:hypothetical protein
MAYAYAPGHMLGMTGAYPSLTMLSGIDVEGDLEFLNQNRRGWDMHRGPGNLQMLHHHPFESYGPMMDNVPGYGILPPGQQPSTSSAVPNYPALRHILTINLRHNNNTPFLATADVTGIGTRAIENGRGRGNVIGSLLQTPRYLTQATSLLRGRYPPFTSMLMGC